ncbi:MULTISPECIES: TetR/AcrR family transcriptional regulator [Streptomyces]|jgi:AcrR family transcriptional regulator|uniref:TetR family transcriptional regulator C-terminal domain-containing protein n=2 Tax=Streptomyces mirabilis TaxID=68239 RepID=A0A1I2AVJ0_9ACTN|nr:MULTISPECIES: TetR family transcriptional regulator C-terminal domain-containing protein [Streptomyces]MCX4427646.1 TetR family transcriptional regulator C-terminal domain-containing protein [Streptomyces mirabilis]MCX4616370.1 TetR family transcriptional regulator C-terminal domain-containing protein [Streptomyces mirabilis]MCX5346869.1 TetR family transcriptional regulator C-terminal domain-containing protein [Streptomyces mirabilis]MDU8999789.1 TetR family transcriptional regulator C-term
MKAARTPRRAVAAADRTRQPTEVRRRLIVEAAVPLIAERGYASVGVRDVAAAAGVSVGTVTYHFGSVQEILSEAMVLHIERYYAALSEAAAQAAGAAEALRLLVDALFTEDTDRHWRMWFDYWNAGDQDPDQAFARGQAERYEAWHTQIRELAERGVAEGEFSSDDLDGFTVRFAALADGLALQRLRQAPPLSTEDARRHLNRLIETELRRRS